MLELGADSSNIKKRATLQSTRFRQKRIIYSNNAYSKIKTKLNPDKFQQDEYQHSHLALHLGASLLLFPHSAPQFKNFQDS